MWRRSQGFTLIEILVVLAIMGFVASFVIINGLSSDPTQKLKTESERFAVIFAMASDAAVMNQKQLGLYVDEDNNLYRFLHLDDNNEWEVLDEPEYFAEYRLDDMYRMELVLDGLAWQEDDNFIDTRIFDETLSVSDDGVQIGEEEETKPKPPQILLLSSGDIGDFSLSFVYESTRDDIRSTRYQINGKGYLPLERTEAMDL